MVFDAYTMFEESVLTAKMRRAEVKHGLFFTGCCVLED